MIITDNTPKSPVKDSTPLLGDASASNAPPAYAPPRADPTPIGNTQIPYVVYQPVYTQQGQQGQRRTEEPAGRRFCKAFLIAFGIWLLVSALFGSITAESSLGYYDYPIPGGVEPSNCATDWPEMTNPDSSDFPYSASTSFDFDLPSKTLLLLSKGGLSKGHLKITSSPHVANVRVKVTVNYWKAAVRDAAKVCFIKRSEGESGVGIFTPQPWRSRAYYDRLFFDVELILPHSDPILHVNGLSTDVSNFSHDVDGLNVYFDDLSLGTSNGKIRANSLTAAQVALTTSNAAVAIDNLAALKASIKSSNGRITGTYAVVDSLTLKTTNGAIDVAASITGSSSSLERPQDITMQTSNGPLNYIVNLGPTAGEAGSFRVKADTTNGNMRGKIVSAPLNSVLAVDAKTSNNKASLALPSTYEGSFAISTSNAAATLEYPPPGQKDPACGSDAKCKDRERVVHAGSNKKYSVQGTVHWDPKNARRGNVNLGSSNGAATLYL
ncbi:hypothetical protein MSAN_01655300 [Mycena sanguinolenta]|uniref:DUF7330 domain-containing protein n=1 Tax=Mycena sanguinolenta TaxID=230812 RepID=A0A8H6Y346_9AGAR|nr:hypothetical protein MSAN_01655300 [Mycena sanguinolenta]